MNPYAFFSGLSERGEFGLYLDGAGHAEMLRLICNSRSVRLIPSSIWPIPAIPDIAAFIPEERGVPRTWVTPRTINIMDVRFRPI